MGRQGAHWREKRERLGIPAEKVCERCGATYSRPPGLRHAYWLERRFCGEPCRRAFAAEHLRDLPPALRGRRPRVVASDEVVAQRRERRAEAARARRARLRAERPQRVRETKTCEGCGFCFERPGCGVTDDAWAARRFCSLRCYHASRIGVRGADHYAWKGDAAKRGNHRARALYPELGACERCGNSAELRHHRDENTLNNEPENIEFLCRPCHVAHHDPIEKRWR